MTFSRNVGGLDRLARLAIGAALILLALAGSIGPWGFAGVVPLATGLLRTCPAYNLLGFNTCKAG
jgi:hypothetical protein